MCVSGIMIRWRTVPRYGVQQKDGQKDGWTDEQTEKVTYRGGCLT